MFRMNSGLWIWWMDVASSSSSSGAVGWEMRLCHVEMDLMSRRRWRWLSFLGRATGGSRAGGGVMLLLEFHVLSLSFFLPLKDRWRGCCDDAITLPLRCCSLSFYLSIPLSLEKKEKGENRSVREGDRQDGGRMTYQIFRRII